MPLHCLDDLAPALVVDQIRYLGFLAAWIANGEWKPQVDAVIEAAMLFSFRPYHRAYHPLSNGAATVAPAYRCIDIEASESLVCAQGAGNCNVYLVHASGTIRRGELARAALSSNWFIQ